MRRILSLLLAAALLLPALATRTQAVTYAGSPQYRAGKYYDRLAAVKLTGNQRTDIVNIAASQIGYQEGNSTNQLGGEIMGKCIYYLTHGARWIMIAALAGTKTEIDLKNIYIRNVRIIGSTLRSRSPEVKAQILAGIVRDVYPKIESGTVKPTIYKVLPITEAESAHNILYRGENVGKVVLSVK